MQFTELDLPHYLRESLDKLKFTEATPIQEKVIPLIKQGKDLLAESQTGTGKTLAFSFPLIERINSLPDKKKKISILGLILVPTRELAVQLEKAFNTYAEFSLKEIKTASLIGGESIHQQIRKLRIGLDVVIATPGRLLELIEQGEVRLYELEMLILDEADKMLDLGFADELKALLSKLPKKRQNLLFSATLPARVQDLATNFLSDAEEVRVSKDQITAENIEQRAIEVDANLRRQVLQKLYQEEEWKHTIIFVSSKRSASNLANKLKKEGLKVQDFHGDLDQEARTKVLRCFQNKDFPILIATDIAARGIDITKLSHVINYDLPRSALDYVHRIGRTGRAGQKGVAISFVNPANADHFSVIEKHVGIKLTKERIPGFDKITPLEAPKIKGPIKGKRKSKKDKLREQLKGKLSDQ
ncbi:DEAD/DEAH box helicase [Lentisphaera profundi]|uniref:DEAD/DEAH box helicase n=1 Tax=Lentisphaera profundi TaxID=1658616 RepID=A0ABY7W1C4_9BACT|nr:DEAD/DEAH box helicase [Lentisphaera profundi]WDE99278.1 DEAD/DEAH box helicase [Lentisphaera profundi]